MFNSLSRQQLDVELVAVESTNKDAVIRAYPGSNILKSHYDTRLYRGITLANGLQVFCEHWIISVIGEINDNCF